MAKVAKNKKYITLEDMRVAYRPKDDTIHLTSADKDLEADGFRLALKRGTESEAALRSLLYVNGMIDAEKSNADLPKRVFINFSNTTPADQIYLGQGYEGPIIWNISKCPNMILGGAVGGGKSVIQRSIFQHCVTHNDKFTFYGVDLKKIELIEFEKYHQTTKQIAKTLEETLEMFQEIRTEMMARYKNLEALGLNNILDLKPTVRPKYLMILIEELSPISYSDEDKDSIKDTVKLIKGILGDLLRLGRAAGVHTVISATESHDGSFIDKYLPGESKSNCGARLAMGRLSVEHSIELLGSDNAAFSKLEFAGRGVLKVHGQIWNFQAGYSTQQELFKWILEHGQELEPELFEELAFIEYKKSITVKSKPDNKTASDSKTSLMPKFLQGFSKDS